MSQARFQKMQREKARREKAAAKQERKAAREQEQEQAAEAESDATAPGDEQRVLAELAKLHDRFEAGVLEFDDFEELKRELLAKLDV